MRKRWPLRAMGVFSALALSDRGNVAIGRMDAADIVIVLSQIAMVVWALIAEEARDA